MSRRYSVVFLSTSGKRASKLASLLSFAGIRVHQASAASEMRILLQITSAAVVLIDLANIEPCEEILRGLAADFPEVCAIVLAPPGAEPSAEFYAEGVFEVVVEPVRFLDLLAALESAHDFHQELSDPGRMRSRVDAIIQAVR
jgi:DNA-binding NtrC family response regulator